MPSHILREVIISIVTREDYLNREYETDMNDQVVSLYRTSHPSFVCSVPLYTTNRLDLLMLFEARL